MAKYRRLWFLLIAIVGITFTLLSYFGAEVYRALFSGRPELLRYQYLRTVPLLADTYLAYSGGKNPKFQKIGVDLLFWALVVVVAGSFIGNFLAFAQIMPANLSFMLGHQGYEYVDLGRVWQIGK